MSDPLSKNDSSTPGGLWVLLAMILTAMAGGMGWGIRGQYGHETGAMIAGVLVGLTLVLLFLPTASSLTAARAVALITAGISFGGSMTYGQTVGLTHDPPLIGNWESLRWGLLGLFIKGGLWIGFAGAFLGIGLGGKRYRPLEMAFLLTTLFVLLLVGVRALNQPFHPEFRILPRFYFSDDWYWEPNSRLEPRPEVWGGLLFALVGLTAYVHFVKNDRLARNMALIGVIAGGLGFSGGQSVQAFHAWNVDWFKTGPFANLEPFMNWWNMMEISFGAIFGAILALGLWLNRRLIVAGGSAEQPPAQADPRGTDAVEISPGWEFVLLADHVFLLVAAEFLGVRALYVFLLFGLVMATLPIICITGGRYWPYLFALPVVAVPIAGKTLRELSYRNAELPLLEGWISLVAIPLAVIFLAAIWLARRGIAGQSSRSFARIGLLLTTWLYFGLNLAFFRFPWPWTEWTGRTPSAIIFTVCAVSLTAAALFLPRAHVAENR